MDLSMMDFDGSDLRGLKMGKTEDFSSVSFSCKNMLRSNSSPIDGQTMLSFSLSDSKNSGFGLYNHTSNEYYTNSGKRCGGGMNGFTPSQWMELEHQALIYKYILSNVPVPSNLLFPIKKALDSAGFFIGPLRPTTYGWGGFHLGLSNNTDPEPGRCRRTDGKKWRCSRDAFPDQKYCEHHINRGRHRSRKPVEVHNNGNSVSVPIATSAKPVASVGLGGGGASDLGGPNLSDSSIKMIGNCLSNDATSERNEATRDLSMFSSEINLKNNEFFTRKQQNPYTEPKLSQFGLVFSDSLVNPIHKTSSETLNERGNTFQSQVHQRPKNQFPILTDLHINAQNNRQANWMPISWESSMGGPLGEALHNTNQNISNECNNNIGLASSPNGPFQRMAFGSQNSSAGSSPRGVALSLTQLM